MDRNMHLTIVVAFMKVVYVALKWDNVQEQVHILYCVVLLILLSYCTLYKSLSDMICLLFVSKIDRFEGN